MPCNVSRKYVRTYVSHELLKFFLIVSRRVDRVAINMNLISPFITHCAQTPYRLK